MKKELNLSRFRWVGLLVILGATLLILLPPYRSFFYFDDYKHLEFIRGIAGQPWTAYKMASPTWIGWNYRPVQMWFFLTNFLLFGVHPAGYYLAMITIHLLNIVLLYALARLWRVGLFGSLLAAVLLAINLVHLDAVLWISSASIVLGATFSLSAVYAYSRFLDTGRRHKALLLLTFFAVIMALLSREENVVVPFLLIAVWALFPGRARPTRPEISAFILLLISLALYGYLQMTRPTWSGPVNGNNLEGILTGLRELEPFAIISRSTIVLLLPGLDMTAISKTIVDLSGLIMGAILLLWFIRGNRASRLGVAWGILYLIGLFGLSSAFSLSLAMRYFYLPWIGFSLALGATLERLSRPRSRYQPVIRIAIIVGLMIFVIYQSVQIRREQTVVEEFVLLVDEVRQQLVTTIPNPDPDSNFFAYEFPPEADYIQAMASVWYDQPFSGLGGHIDRLLQLGTAETDDYVLTYEDNHLINLMPELQVAQLTFFIWEQSPLIETVRPDGTAGPLAENNYQLYQVVGPSSSRRFASYLHPPAPEEGWASLVYPVIVPQDSTLQFGIRRENGGLAEEDGLIFRVRATDASGTTHTLFNQFVDVNEHSDDNPWTDISIPMKDYWGQEIELRFETAANNNVLHDHAYWANPRFTIGQS